MNKKGIDLFQGKYTKNDSSPRIMTKNRLNDNIFNIANREFYTSRINTDALRNEILLKSHQLISKEGKK